MEKVYRGIAELRIESDDIEHLSADALDMLRVGDTVVKEYNGEKHLYKVDYRKDDGSEIAMTYAGVHNIEELYWEKGVSGWGDCIKTIKSLD